MSKWLYRVSMCAVWLWLIFNADVSYAQITVSADQSAAALARKLAGQGVTILNPILNCPARANGFFSSQGTLPGFDSGIVLTTGRAATSGTAYGVDGYSTYLASTDNSATGDAQLDALVGQPTMDACSLEFDMLPLGDTLSVDYVFSSEEYISAVCGPYNDAFAFFISGPGISGTYNMARVPGTNIPVTINSINNGVPGSTGIIDSCTIIGPGSPFTSYYRDNSSGTYLTHKGLTTVLTAMHAVTRCATYHMKIVIADAGNPFYDSGVFLKAGSLQTDHYNIEAVLTTALDTAAAVCVKGCLPARFVVKRSAARNTSQTVHYLIHGTAVSGFDYMPIADSVVIPAYASSTIVPVTGVATPANGVKTLQLLILSPACGGSSLIVDSASINIYDTLQLSVSPIDTILCSDDTMRFRVHADDIYTYQWTPAVALSNSNVKDPFAYPHVNTIYTVTALLPGTGCPSKTSTSDIALKLSPRVYLVADTNVCYHTTFNLAPDVAPVNPNYNYAWNGPGGFVSALANPVLSNVTVASTGIYTFTVTNDTNRCKSVNEISVIVNTPDTPHMLTPVTVCLNTTAEPLTTSGQDLLWYSSATGTGSNAAPVIPTTIQGQYNYYVSQIVNNCESPKEEIFISVKQCCDGGIFIPTAFTPNNDGLNDIFEPRPDYGYYIKAVGIYNRWGQLVYSGTDGKWNGKFGLVDADQGTYFYTITFGCVLGGSAERRGDVILIR